MNQFNPLKFQKDAVANLSEMFVSLWKENPEEHERFTSLPNFSWKIFTEITGIRKDTEDEVEITVEGKTKTISRKSAEALNLI